MMPATHAASNAHKGKITGEHFAEAIRVVFTNV